MYVCEFVIHPVDYRTDCNRNSLQNLATCMRVAHLQSNSVYNEASSAHRATHRTLVRGCCEGACELQRVVACDRHPLFFNRRHWHVLPVPHFLY